MEQVSPVIEDTVNPLIKRVYINLLYLPESIRTEVKEYILSLCIDHGYGCIKLHFGKRNISFDLLLKRRNTPAYYS